MPDFPSCFSFLSEDVCGLGGTVSTYDTKMTFIGPQLDSVISAAQIPIVQNTPATALRICMYPDVAWQYSWVGVT